MKDQRKCKNCEKEFFVDFFPCRLKKKTFAKFCSVKCHNLSMKGEKRDEKFVEICRKAQTGRKHSEKSKNARSRKMKLKYKLGLMPDQTKEKNPNWKGGYKNYNPIRSSSKYKKFIRKVKKKYKECLWCCSIDRLEVDHIKRFNEYPKLRFRMSNVRVLCHKCHKKTHTYGNKTKNFLNIPSV